MSAADTSTAELELEHANGAAGFADLAAQAGAIDAGAGLAVATPAAAIDPAATMAAEFFALLNMPRSLAAPRFAWWPEFGNVWSDEQLHAIAGALAALCIDQGWSLADLMGKYGPWIAVAMATGLPSFVTWSAIQDRRAELARQAEHARQAERDRRSSSSSSSSSGHP